MTERSAAVLLSAQGHSFQETIGTSANTALFNHRIRITTSLVLLHPSRIHFLALQLHPPYKPLLARNVSRTSYSRLCPMFQISFAVSRHGLHRGTTTMLFRAPNMSYPLGILRQYDAIRRKQQKFPPSILVFKTCLRGISSSDCSICCIHSRKVRTLCSPAF